MIEPRYNGKDVKQFIPITKMFEIELAVDKVDTWKSKILKVKRGITEITFEGDFLTDERFTNAFLWLKNSETFVAKSNEEQVDFISYNFGGQYPVNDVITVDLTANTFEYFGLSGTNFCNVYFLPTCNVAGVQSYFNVYRNDILLYTIPFTSSTSEINAGAILHDAIGESPFGTGIIKITVNSDTPITFTSRIWVVVEYTDEERGIVLDDDNYIVCNTPQVTTSNLDLKLYMPDIKVEDFFSGILKMFNLTCVLTSAGLPSNKTVSLNNKSWIKSE